MERLTCKQVNIGHNHTSFANSYTVHRLALKQTGVVCHLSLLASDLWIFLNTFLKKKWTEPFQVALHYFCTVLCQLYPLLSHIGLRNYLAS